MVRRMLCVVLAVVVLTVKVGPAFADPPQVYRFTETYDVRKRVVVPQKRQSYLDFKREKDMIMASAATGRVLPAYLEVAEASQASGVTGVISTVVGNSELFFRAFKDVWVATGGRSFTYGGDENLNDVEKRARFWKEQGIYAKYTPREIAFINKVVLPAVLAVRAGQGVGGAALVAAGAAALFAAPFLPVMGVTLGTAALVTGAKAWLIKHSGQGISPLLSQDWFSAGGTVVPGAIGGITAMVEGAALPTQLAAAKQLGAIGSIVAGGALLMDAALDTARLVNAWGIPEPGREPTTVFICPPEEPPYPTSQSGALPPVEINIRYRLTK